MTDYSILHLPACADYQGYQYPDRWEVVRKETWRMGGVPKTIIHTIKEFFAREEAEAFLVHCVNADVDAAWHMSDAAERRAGAYCL
jgi:hypothetical protein